MPISKKKRKYTRKWKNGNINGFLFSKTKLNKTLKKMKKMKKKDIQESLKLVLPPSNQHNSGRCWMFAYLNTLRTSVIHHYKLPLSFSFSASYMMFWDKYEKCKYFLEKVSTYSHLSLDEYDNHFLFHHMISDGGTWNMLHNLVEKYGLVPYESMKESFHTLSTKQMSSILSQFLKTFSKKLRQAPKSKHTSMIQKQMVKIKHFLEKAIGVPPKKVKFATFSPCAPKMLFSKYVGTLPGNSFEKKVVLIHVPHLNQNQYYTIPELNNMKQGHPLLYFNTSGPTFKQAILKELESNTPVWFGSDYEQFQHKDESFSDNQLFDYRGFEFKKEELILKKSNSIPYYQTNPNHAMVLHGFYYKTKPSQPCFWIVENSHDAKMKKISYEYDAGKIIISDSWFDNYVIIASVNHTSILSKQVRDKIKDKSSVISLPKWSPLGELL